MCWYTLVCRRCDMTNKPKKMNLPKALRVPGKKDTRYGEMTCQWCGRVFPNLYSLRIHFAHCSLRSVLRDWLITDPVTGDQLIFHVFCNPRKDVINPITQMISENATPLEIYGVTKYLTIRGFVHRVVFEKYQPGMILHQGPTSYKKKKEIMLGYSQFSEEAKQVILNSEDITILDNPPKSAPP